MHCSYHKCLTVYFGGVIKRVLRANTRPGAYKHFNSFIDEFYAFQDEYKVASVNNHALDLSRYEKYRITRFIRDPRDMIVSGYLYHRRAAEVWCETIAPDEKEFAVVNGTISAGLRDSGLSYAAYLQGLNVEEGLLTEMEFRKNHFESMRQWPMDDPDIRLFRYEDILGREAETMREMLSFLHFPWHVSQFGGFIAKKRSATSHKKSGFSHIRDPRAGQWRDHFTSRVEREFDSLYGDLVEQYGYSSG